MSGLNAVNNYVNNAANSANEVIGRMTSRAGAGSSSAGAGSSTMLWIGLAVLVIIGIVAAVLFLGNKGKKTADSTETEPAPKTVYVQSPATIQTVYVPTPGETREVTREVIKYLPAPPQNNNDKVVTPVVTPVVNPLAKQPAGTYAMQFLGATNIWRYSPDYTKILTQYGRGAWLTFALGGATYRFKFNNVETVPIHQITLQRSAGGGAWTTITSDAGMGAIKFSKSAQTAPMNFLKITGAASDLTGVPKAAPKAAAPKAAAPKATDNKDQAKAKGYLLQFASFNNVHVKSPGYAAIIAKYASNPLGWLSFKSGSTEFRLRFNKAKSANVHNATLQKKIDGTFTTVTDNASMSPLVASPSAKTAKTFDVVVTSVTAADPAPAPSKGTDAAPAPVGSTPDVTPGGDGSGRKCSAGKVDNGTKCIDGPDLCASKGKVWNGSKCVTDKSGGGGGGGGDYTPPDNGGGGGGGSGGRKCSAGKVDNGTKCIDGPDLCASKGKVWNGSKCVTDKSGGGGGGDGGGGSTPPDNGGGDVTPVVSGGGTCNNCSHLNKPKTDGAKDWECKTKKTPAVDLCCSDTTKTCIQPNGERTGYVATCVARQPGDTAWGCYDPAYPCEGKDWRKGNRPACFKDKSYSGTPINTTQPPKNDSGGGTCNNCSHLNKPKTDGVTDWECKTNKSPKVDLCCSNTTNTCIKPNGERIVYGGGNTPVVPSSDKCRWGNMDQPGWVRYNDNDCCAKQGCDCVHNPKGSGEWKGTYKRSGDKEDWKGLMTDCRPGNEPPKNDPPKNPPADTWCGQVYGKCNPGQTCERNSVGRGFQYYCKGTATSPPPSLPFCSWGGQNQTGGWVQVGDKACCEKNSCICVFPPDDKIKNPGGQFTTHDGNHNGGKCDPNYAARQAENQRLTDIAQFGGS
jgi:hypothetical protein